MLAQLPAMPGDFLNKIFDEPVQTSTGSSLESAPKPEEPQEKPKGLPPPDLTKPRNAWLFSALKDGSQLAKIVQDGDFDRIDPVHTFSPNFPPTFFIHGLADPMIPSRLSRI